MGNFVTGNTPLPPLFVDANAPAGRPGELDAAHMNGINASLGDLRDHTRGWVNARSYGLACDGATNDYPALAAMLTLLGSTPATLIVPGPCVVGTSVTIPATLPVRFEGAGAFAGAGAVTFTRWGGVAGSSLFTTAPRLSKTWSMASNGIVAVGTAAPTVFGGQQNVSGADRFWLQYTPTAAVGNVTGTWWGGAAGWTQLAYLPKFVARMRLNQLTNVIAFVDLCYSVGGSNLTPTPVLGGGTTADTNMFVSIRFDPRAGGGHWIAGSGNGTAAVWTDLGIAANTTDDWLLLMEALTPTSVKMTAINCTTGAQGTVTLTTNLPPTTRVLGPDIGAYNTTALTVAGPYLGYAYMESN